ncbi:MAG: hypothetical protein KDD62_13370 [Bdellovibrionales bacterium]|nr:hypothetical protein [Bdellovibrionales bacterium]
MRPHQHLFPIVNQMVEVAVEELREEGGEITCGRGCDHCCHLLVETSWEEARELAIWLANQPAKKRDKIFKRVQESAEDARELFGRRKSTKKFKEPYDGDSKIKDDAYDEYFYEKKRPCPFLEKGACIAYVSRPTPCRLHMVTSDPYYCRYDVDNEEGFDYPDSFDELKDNAAHAIVACEKDGRWGQMGIMVEAVVAAEGFAALARESI